MKRYEELARDNRRRVMEGTGSPKILVGSINLLECPNFHTLSLVELGASLVGISDRTVDIGRPEKLYIDRRDNLHSMLEHRLPPKWRPDFFLDLQAEHGHWLPIGLGDIPIPKIVTCVHAHLGYAFPALCEMFDEVVMPTAETAHLGTSWLPCGGSWGTMNTRIEMHGGLYDGEAEKPVTVVCPMSQNAAAHAGVRRRVIEEAHALSRSRQDWTVVVVSGLDQADYFKLLGSSKVVLNVGTWGNPLGYRPFEAIAQEAVLVHFDETGYGSPGRLKDLFEPHWFVDASEMPLEEAVEEALKRTGTVKEVKAEVEERYSYVAQHRRLLDLISGTQRRDVCGLRDWSRRAFMVSFLPGFVADAAPHAWSLTHDDILSASSEPKEPRDVSLWAPSDPEERWKWQTGLSLAARGGR